MTNVEPRAREVQPPTSTATMYGGSSATPIPDPTVLTNAAVAAAVAMLRREQEGLERSTTTRMDGMDRAIELVRQSADALPDRMDEKIGHLHDLLTAHFEGRARSFEQQMSGVQRQLDTLEAQHRQATQEAKEAVAAALLSAQKLSDAQTVAAAAASEKTERNVTTLLEQLATQQSEGIRSLNEKLDVRSRGLDEKIAAIDARLTRSEGSVAGASTSQVDQRASSSFAAYLVFAVIGALVGLAGIALAIFR